MHEGIPPDRLYQYLACPQCRTFITAAYTAQPPWPPCPLCHSPLVRIHPPDSGNLPVEPPLSSLLYW